MTKEPEKYRWARFTERMKQLHLKLKPISDNSYISCWCLLLAVAAGFFFSSYITVEKVLVILLVCLSIIMLFAVKSISKWIIFVISMAIGVFFLNVIYFEKKEPQETDLAARLEEIISSINKGLENSPAKSITEIHTVMPGEPDLLENSKGVLSPYLERKSDWLAIILSLISLVFVVYTWNSQDKTQKNTQRITPDIQKGILKDLFRHSYKNLIVLTAIRIRLRQDGFDKFYPAEYHITKLQTEESAIFPEVFADNDENCGRLHELKLFIRNGNLEIKEVLEHLKNPHLDAVYKERGINLISRRITDIMDRVGTVLEEMYGLDAKTERAIQIKEYMFKKTSNASERSRLKFKERIRQIIEETDPVKRGKFADLCAENPPKDGIIDYAILVEVLYPQEKADKAPSVESTDSISESPQTIEGFVKRINAEIFKMVEEIHLLPFS